MQKISGLIISVSLVVMVFLTGCRDDIELSADASIGFSADTLRFDTVFSGLRSSTLTLMVRNPNKGRLKLDRVFLEKGSGSEFRFNIDGIAGENNDVSGIEIGGKDSVYVFVDVKMPENGQETPLLARDNLNFFVNGKLHKVVLESYGQDVIIMRDKYIVHDTILTAQRPYLIYGYLAVDTLYTITLEPGTKLYFHDDAMMVVFGTMIANGTLQKPVVMRGDRLDQLFANVPYSMVSGQWEGLYINHGKTTHVLDYLEVYGAVNGIYASSWDRNMVQSIEMINCRIHNNAGNGLTAINTNLKVVNTEISNSAEYCVYLAGGNHEFVHSTIANYYGNTNVNIQNVRRKSVPAVCINDIPKTANMSTVFRNCIISGTQQTEWSLLSYFENQYPVSVSSTYMRCDSIEDTRYTDNRYWHWGDEMFLNDYYSLGYYEDYDFGLDENSPARGIGDTEQSALYPVDRKGNSRPIGEKPDAGCYQYIETEEE